VKEYELYVPLDYNDGSPIEKQKHERIAERILRQFGHMTYFDQPSQGQWTLGGVTYKDRIVIFRVVSDKVREARRFFRQLKEDLKKELRQEEIFIVEKDAHLL
jgi:hypothetical protein